ncbi:MAG TPA: hypothetical protein VHK46_04725 [Gaiellaceae bacterium]|jgi:hypothetical protein|nr:hypothetical protein [Gaiellaceae bacterium]
MPNRIELTKSTVEISLSGLERVLALTKGVTVPYDQIESVEVGLTELPSKWTLQRVGLYDPVTGRRRGRFDADSRRYFLDLHRPERALVLRLRPGSRFDVVAIETSDAERLAGEIRSRRP